MNHEHTRLGRLLAASTTAAVLTIGAAVGTAASPAAAAATCAGGRAIGVMGPYSGDNAAFGIAIDHGAALAVVRHNKAHPGCRVRIVRSDSKGDPATAPAAATRLINDASVLGVVGPAFSGETLATGKAYARAGLVTITPSATNPVLSAQRWPTFFRGTINDRTIGSKTARLLIKTLHAKRICIVRDGSDYGAVSSAAVSRHLGKRKVCTVTLNVNRPNYKAAASKIKSKRASAVYFAGYDVQAAKLVRTLRASHFKGTFVAGDGSYSSLFVKRAGKAGRGAYVVSGTAPRTVDKAFAALYRKTYRSAVPSYAAEAYDAANLLLAGIDHGVSSRTAMRNRMRSQRTTGITQRFVFTRTGELAAPNAWAYKVGKGTYTARRIT